MQVLFESRDPDAARLRDLAVARLQFVLRRLHSLVPLARVRLSDVNGPRGGVDKRCQVELNTEGAGKVVITALARDRSGAANLNSAISGNSGRQAGPRKAWREGVFDGQESGTRASS